jgi:phospholipase/carboxylesterase
VTSNPHADQPVVVEGDLDEARVVVVLLHGRDRGHDDLRSTVVEPCTAPGLAFLCPLAAGRSWYPASFLAPVEDNQPWLGHALERVGQVVEDAVARVGRDQVVLAGYSQGACLASEWMYCEGIPVGGLVAFTGGLIGPRGTSWAPRPSLAGMRVFMGAGDRDDFVPEDRVRETAAVFDASGAKVDLNIYPGCDHIVSDAERESFAALIADLMG